MSSKLKEPEQEEEQHPILSLPNEILEVILNKIPQNETLNLRLVCKAWNNDVENLYNHEVKGLDEDSPHFQRILQLRTHKLSIKTLMKASVLNSEGNYIFKYPEVIRVLKLEPYSSVSPVNLQQLLGLCAETVRVLLLDVSQKQLNYEFPMDQVLRGYTFSNLKELKVSFKWGYASYKTVPENSKSLFQILENSKMLQLQVLRIQLDSSSRLSLETSGRIGESILRILSRSGIRLEILDLNIFNYPYYSELEQFPLIINKDELNQIMQMNRVQAFNVTFRPFALQLQNFWQQLISNQKQLVKLATCKLPISIPLCQQIVKTNCATLVDITIWKLSLLADDPPFDLSVFQTCHNLKNLYLHRTDVLRTNPEQPDVRKFHCLPESITELKLLKLKILSEELLIGFTQGWKNLQKVDFDQCGMSGVLGVNWSVLSEILTTSRPDLTEVRLYRSVNSEDKSLKIELGRLGLSLSDLKELHKNCSVEPGHFDWFHMDD